MQIEAETIEAITERPDDSGYGSCSREIYGPSHSVAGVYSPLPSYSSVVFRKFATLVQRPVSSGTVRCTVRRCVA